jgi:hypothetical protein
MLFEVIMGLPSSLQNELCKFILLAFLANIATSELWQREYRTWVKIAVALFVLTVLYVMGRLFGYVLRRVSGRHRWSRPVATADVIHHSDVTMPSVSPLRSLSPAARRASLHVTRRASAAQALEALQQVSGVVSTSLSEVKVDADIEIALGKSDDEHSWDSTDMSESTSRASTQDPSSTQENAVLSSDCSYSYVSDTSMQFSSDCSE